MTPEQQNIYEVLTGQYGPVFETIEMWACITALGVKPFKDGNLWCFQYGENSKDGVCGYGRTIEDAARSFYHSVSEGEGYPD